MIVGEFIAFGESLYEAFEGEVMPYVWGLKDVTDVSFLDY